MTKWMKSLALLIALSVIGIAFGSTGDQAHDGKWWLSVDEDQRLGFVAGYMVTHPETGSSTIVRSRVAGPLSRFPVCTSKVEK
jgi:hypothetical protein